MLANIFTYFIFEFFQPFYRRFTHLENPTWSIVIYQAVAK